MCRMDPRDRYLVVFSSPFNAHVSSYEQFVRPDSESARISFVAKFILILANYNSAAISYTCGACAGSVTHAEF